MEKLLHEDADDDEDMMNDDADNNNVNCVHIILYLFLIKTIYRSVQSLKARSAAMLWFFIVYVSTTAFATSANISQNCFNWIVINTVNTHQIHVKCVNFVKRTQYCRWINGVEYITLTHIYSSNKHTHTRAREYTDTLALIARKLDIWNTLHRICFNIIYICIILVLSSAPQHFVVCLTHSDRIANIFFETHRHKIFDTKCIRWTECA